MKTNTGGLIIQNTGIYSRSRQVLSVLAILGTASPATLASHMGKSVQNVSIALKDLETHGLIKCTTPNKRTWKEYTISPNGLKFWAESQSINSIMSLEKENLSEIDHAIKNCVSKGNINKGAFMNLLRVSSELLWDKNSNLGFIIGDIPKEYIFSGLHYNSDAIKDIRDFLKRSNKIINGETFAYHFTAEGFLNGIIRLELLNGNIVNPLLWKDEQPYSSLTLGGGAMGVQVLSNRGIINIYANGEKILTFREGFSDLWITQKLTASISQIVTQHHIDKSLVNRLSRIALHMSEMKMGTLMLVGHFDQISEIPTSELSNEMHISGINISSLKDEEILSLAKEDGAILFDNQGYLRGLKVQLCPKKETKVEIYPERGMRHITAAKISKETGTVAIVVSDDGPLTIYDRGKMLLSLSR